MGVEGFRYVWRARDGCGGSEGGVEGFGWVRSARD